MALNNQLALSINLSTKGGLQQALAEFQKLTQAEKDLAIQAGKSAQEQIAEKVKVREAVAKLSKDERQLYKDKLAEQLASEKAFTQTVIQLTKDRAKEAARAAKEAATLPEASGPGLPSLGNIFYAAQNLQFAFGAVKATVTEIGVLLVGQNQQLQSLQFQTAAALSNSLTVTDATTNRQLEGVEKIKALRAVAAQQQQDLEKKSFDLVGVTSQQLQSVLAITNQQVQQTGFTLNQNTDIATRFAAALGTYGVPLEQARQEVQSILSGQIDQNSILAQSLGITNEQVKAEKERGTLYDFLIKKTQAAVDANKLQSQTIEGYTSNLQELFEQFARSLGEPLTDEITKELGELYNYIIENKDALLSIAKEAGPNVSAAFKVLSDTVKSAYDTLSNLSEGIGANKAIFESLASTLGGKVLFAFNSFLISLNGLSLLLKVVGIGFQEFQAIVANGLDITKTKADIARLDEELRQFAEKTDKRNRELGAAAFQGLVNPNYVKEQFAQLAATEKAEQQKREADLKAEQERTKAAQAQTAEKQLEEFKRTEDAKTAAIDAALAQRKLKTEQSLASGLITQREADDQLVDAERQALQSRLAVLEDERRLTVASVGDKGKDVAALDKQIAETRLGIVKSLNKQILDDEKEANALALNLGRDQKQNIASQLDIAQKRAELTKQGFETQNKQVELQARILDSQGRSVEADQLRQDLLIKQAGQLVTQYALQLKILDLQNRAKQVDLDVQIIQAEQNLESRQRAGAKSAELDLLQRQIDLLKESKGVYTEVGAEQKAALAQQLKADTVQKLQAAQTQYQREQILKAYDAELRSQKLSESQIQKINRALEEEADSLDTSAKNADELSSNLSVGTKAAQAAENKAEQLAYELQVARENADGIADGLNNAADAASRIKVDPLESKNASSGKYEGRAGGLTAPFIGAAGGFKNDTQAKSDKAGDAYQAAVDRAFATGAALPTFGDPSTYNAKPGSAYSRDSSGGYGSFSPTANTGSIPSAYGGSGQEYLESQYGPQVVPNRAEGGIDFPRPGGMVRRVEGRSPEATIPLNQQGAQYMAGVIQQYAPPGNTQVNVDQEKVVGALATTNGLLERSLQRNQQIILQGGMDGGGNGGSDYYANRQFNSQYGR